METVDVYTIDDESIKIELILTITAITLYR
jgi:hypothetical protein